MSPTAAPEKHVENGELRWENKWRSRLTTLLALISVLGFAGAAIGSVFWFWYSLVPHLQQNDADLRAAVLAARTECAEKISTALTGKSHQDLILQVNTIQERQDAIRARLEKVDQQLVILEADVCRESRR